MIKTLVRKEILNNLLNLRFALAYFLCTFLLVGSSAIMLGDFLADKDVYDVNKSAYDRQLSDTHDMWDYIFGSKVVLRPPVVARIFALGGEKDADQRASVAAEFPPYLYGDFKRNPISNLFPSVDMVFIIGVIISLLIFVLTYDSISGEREEGTLKVLLSCPIPRDLVIVAKWLGGFVSLIIPLATSWVIIVLVLLFTRGVTITAGEWTRIVALFFVSAVYVGTVFSLSLMVSMLFRSSGAAILALLFVWVTLIVALPAASSSAAHLLIHPDSVQKSALGMRRIGVLGWGPVEHASAQEFKKRFGGRDWPELSERERKEWGEYRRDCDFHHVVNIVDSQIDIGHGVSRSAQRVDNVARWLCRLSPYGCYQNAAVALAGTGMQHELDIRAALEEYGRKAVAFAVDFGKTGKDPDQFVPDIAPRARVDTVSLGSALAGALLDIGLLVIMGVLFFMAGYIAFMRSDTI